MLDKKTIKLLSDLSLTLFRKNLFGIYHGAISSKIDHQHFIINKSDAIFDEMHEDSFCKLNIYQKDYSWRIASAQSETHASIYTHIHDAKYIAFGAPIYTTAYTFEHEKIVFEDYYGKKTFDSLDIIDPGDFSTWHDRSSLEITKYLKENNSQIMVIKGVGTYIYDRNIHELIKKVAILENSCRLLSIKTSYA